MVGGLTSTRSLSVADHQGMFGEHFVDAIAAAAGLTIWTANLDREGIDRKFGMPGPYGTIRHPQIEAQVKGWSRPVVVGESWRYPLRTKYFNDLAGRDFGVPRFLIVVVVPSGAHDWALATPDALMLRHAAYWVCLHDETPIPNHPPDGQHTVSVPRANLLTPDSLRELFADSFRAKLA